jgi:hypothetical protein
MLCFKNNLLPRKSKGSPRFILALFFLGLLFTVSACKPPFGRNEPLPAFDGVTTEFTLTRSRIRADQQLEVHVIFRNTGRTPRTFRFLDFGVDARLYSKGKRLEDLCGEGLDYPLQVLTLKPGETSEGTAEVFTPVCYKLAPGRYSIRFHYNLRALENDSLSAQYEEKYNHPLEGIVPWDGREHVFTVVK